MMFKYLSICAIITTTNINKKIIIIMFYGKIIARIKVDKQVITYN